MVTSIEFFYGTVYLPYAVFASIMYILNNYKPSIDYYPIDYALVLKTLTLYLNIFIVYALLLIVFKKPKQIDIESELKYFEQKLLENRSILNIGDIIAGFCCAFYGFLIIKAGPSYFTMYVLNKREAIDTQINQYVYLYMLVYSLSTMVSFFIMKKENKSNNISYKLIMICLYWAMSLTNQRRYFITLCAMIMILYIQRLKKLKSKHIILILLFVVGFMSIAFFREGNMSSYKMNRIIYSLTTEFNCTQYITYYYLDFNVKHLWGTTYIYNSLCSLIPRAIFPNKPLDLCDIFMNMANLKVNLAFNPVAEGILNFGKYVVVAVPLLMLAIVSIGKRVLRINPLFYAILCGYSINFFRGAFSNAFFDVLFLMFFAFMMSYIRIPKPNVYYIDYQSS